MDLREDVFKNIDGNNYDDFTKIRWIYLFVCEKFSYDIRFIYGRKSLKDKIYNKNIDISNVDEFELVCYTYAHILVDLLALYGIRSEIVRENGGDFPHAYVVVKHKGKEIKLDPTIKHDTTRVKMNSETLDFQTLIDDPIFYDQLKEADEQIRYNKDETIDYAIFYNSESIMQLIKILEKSAVDRKISKEELFFEKLEYVFSLINTRTDFHRYDDIDYYFSYLLKKFKLNDEKYYVKPAIFFKINDNNMRDIINIILIEYDNLPPLFYLLEKVGDNFKIRESDNKEVLNLLEEYSNWKVDEYFRAKAKKGLTK